MDAPQEYEVESVTKARVHDKKGKKITWKYYVKWKGYGWDESTWEPTDSFQGGSEHILETFWERIDTSGRDISDATAFKKGEELFISGPPGRKDMKRKANPVKAQVLPSFKNVPSSNDVTISAPPLASRKRRQVQISVGDEWGYSKPKRRASTGVPKSARTSPRSPKRRRVSSPRPVKSAPKRPPSPGDSQLDADGETDPDVVEVEDELMQVSVGDAEEGIAEVQCPATASGSANGSKKITFDDLEHFYSGNPIDIDQNADEQVVAQKSEPHPLPTTSPHAAPESETPASPTISSPDPLFDSPSRFSGKTSEVQGDLALPHHRARAANPLVKLIDTAVPGSSSKQSRITAKARLMNLYTSEAPSTGGPSRNVAKRGGKPVVGRSSGLNTKSRSSLLTATNGTLKSVKGTFKGTPTEHEQPDETEETPAARDANEGVVTHQDRQTTLNSHSPPPSGDELLKLAGLQTDSEVLPDYQDDSAAQPQEVKEVQGPESVSAEEELPNQPSLEVANECKAGDQAADTPLPASEAGQQASAAIIDDPSIQPVVAHPADEVVRKNIELAKEHLFPSTQTSFNSFTTQSPFQSTIFGPLYQGSTANPAPAVKNELSTTFKVIPGDSVELPLVLMDCGEIKTRISDILIGNSSGSKVALFYFAEDALAMVSTFKSDGTARVSLDPSATTIQQGRFLTLLQRFESSQTLIAPVGKEVCVLYSSRNADIAEKLGAPKHLRGLESTLLMSHASIENQLAYVAAVMKATAV